MRKRMRDWCIDKLLKFENDYVFDKLSQQNWQDLKEIRYLLKADEIVQRNKAKRRWKI